MKRVIAFLCAAILTIGMTATIYAAPSVSVSGIVTAATNAVDKDGNTVEAVISNVPEKYADVVADIKAEGAIKEVLGDAYKEGMQLVDVKDVTVPEGTEFPVTITFAVAGVTSSSSVAVLHYDDAAGAWEVVDSKAGNGTITATFNSLSPVAFIVDKNTAASNGTGSNGTTPATGDSNAVLPTVLIAVVALAGAAVLFIKRKRA